MSYPRKCTCIMYAARIKSSEERWPILVFEMGSHRPMTTKRFRNVQRVHWRITGEQLCAGSRLPACEVSHGRRASPRPRTLGAATLRIPLAKGDCACVTMSRYDPWYLEWSWRTKGQHNTKGQQNIPTIRGCAHTRVKIPRSVQ